ncbi:MAG: ATPase P [Clostridium sp.]
MLINIPGRGEINIEYIIFDYNGTIAVNGSIKEDIKEKLSKINNIVNTIVLTADTYGSAKRECDKVGLTTKIFPKENAGEFKKDIVQGLGAKRCLCIGNGYNDIGMCSIAVLSIGVIEGEGMCSSLINNTDIVVSSIDSALDIILNKERIIATLRN